MSERIHVLAQELFAKSSVAACNLEEVKNAAQRYPYFAPAHFLLLEKLKLEGSAAYAAQLQKSILYYHSPLEFEYFISSDKFYTEINFEEDQNANPVAAERIVADEEIHNDIQDVFIASETMALNPDEKDFQDEVATPADEVEIPTHSESTLISGPEVLPQEPEPAFIFEPYHTVDYFASQGIRLSQEEAPGNKFDKQLKSFTEWLKTMKRLPASHIKPAVDIIAETTVQHLAEDSVHEADVCTEAMAEVWQKQGNTQKAIEVYNKLSLLNPSKKTFFAAKIENLKRF